MNFSFKLHSFGAGDSFIDIICPSAGEIIKLSIGTDLIGSRKK